MAMSGIRWTAILSDADYEWSTYEMSLGARREKEKSATSGDLHQFLTA